MPTPSQQSSRVPVFLLLVGAAGLLAPAVGAVPSGSPWVWFAVLSLGACLPLLAVRAGAQAFDSEERLANDRARENMKWSVERQDRRLTELADTVEKVAAHALQPGEAPEIRKAMMDFAADLQVVKQELVNLKEAENMRRFNSTLRGEPEGT